MLCLVLLLLLLQWGASCGDYNGGCDMSCATGTLDPQLWYLPPGKAYYTQKLGEQQLLLQKQCSAIQ
jgi:hypothetical protein